MRFAVDTGGTFTDLLVETDDHALATFKASTTPANPITGVMDALGLAATGLGLSLGGLLGRGDMFIHGTTHGLNAILTDTAARTAFLTTAGHPDILLFREGGRTGPFDWTREYQAPYVPRALTFEVPERCSAEGKIVKPLDEEGVIAICRQLREAKIEAVGVCLLWSVGNPVHERRVGELLDEHLPGIPYTLSHRQPGDPRVSPRVLDVHRRFAEANPRALLGGAPFATGHRGLRGPRLGRQLGGWSDGRGRRGGCADSAAREWPCDGTDCRPSLCRARR
jgi:N-methylhydantoinase A/oxoprolinase/acetone carboxylase beta subunit